MTLLFVYVFTNSENFRRAKIKMIAKKGIETGEACDAIPESMRQYLALNSDSTKSHAGNLFNRSGSYGGDSMNGSSPSGKIGA